MRPLQVEWGIDLSTEHERYLTEEIFKQPVIVYNYPKEIKAFYMRLNDDNKTVAAMDVLVPKVFFWGEGGMCLGAFEAKGGVQERKRRAY